MARQLIDRHALPGDVVRRAFSGGVWNRNAVRHERIEEPNIYTSETATGLSRTSKAFSHASASALERTQTSPGYFRLGLPSHCRK
jgi:hypothetical protein